MLKFIQALFFLTFIMSMLSCSTSSEKTQKDENSKIQTAKINARLGIAYLEQNNVARAKQKLLLALDEAPNIPETWYSMGYLLETTGNTQEADKYYLQALALGPHRGDAQNNYGTFLCRTGHYKASIEHFAAAAQDPKYLSIGATYENAGLCALKIPNKKLAIKYFKMALMQDPNRHLSFTELNKLTKA